MPDLADTVTALAVFGVPPFLLLWFWTRRTRALRSAECRFQALLDSASEGVYGIDRDGRCTCINRVGAAMFGYEPEEILGKDLHASLHHSRPDRSPYPEEDCPILRTLKSGQEARGNEEVFWRRDGTALPVAYTAAPLSDGGDITGALVTFTDLTQRNQVADQLLEMAHYDSLTGLPNRRLFLELLARAIARAKRTDRVGALLFMDLDRFKRMNDRLGHACGDLLLKEFASRLAACVRETDTVARLGGDEFTVILENLLLPEEAAVIAQRILHAMAQPFIVREREIFVTCSIGIAIFPSDSTDTDTLITDADTAMYEAKVRRGAYRFFSPGMKTLSAERVDLESGLRHALKRGELVLFYQPQIDVRSGALVAVEALIRWKHPEYGFLPPSSFISLSEETGLIVPIGEWALRTACRQLKTWQASGTPPLRVGVNLSRVQLQHPNLVKTVRQVLQETDIDPGCLDLEITETLLIQNGMVAVDTLHALQGLGVRCSVDDFGTGYSSLSYLKDLPIHALKIDQSFVKNVTTRPKDALIVKTIISLAHALDLEIVAEGVETADQRDFLRTEQCFVMQGYYFAHPESAEALAARLGRCEAGAVTH